MTKTPEKPRRGRPKTLRKADVTDVAMRAYWAHGPADVSLNAICQQAGVSKPSVYREFGNDDGLAHAALSAYAENVLGKSLEITRSDASFSNKINDLMRLTTQGDLYEHGCLLVKMRAVQNRLGPKTQDLIKAVEQMGFEAFSTVLADARADGSWPGDTPVALGARYLQAQIGLALDQRARGEDPTDTLALALSVFGVTDP